MRQKYQKILFACALVAGVTTSQAQSNVVFYGLLDGGITNLSNSYVNYANQNSGLRTTKFASKGGLNSNMWGIRGEEDLGNGLKAEFNLESGFALGTGAVANPGATTSYNYIAGQTDSLFSRAANVSLTSSWGKVTLGRQRDAALISYAVTDPRSFSQQTLSFQTNWVATIGAASKLAGAPYGLSNITSGNTNTAGGIFDNNAISYTFKTNGLTGIFLYAPGGVAGNTTANSLMSSGLIFDYQTLKLSAGYYSSKQAASGSMDVRATNIGAAYGLGLVTLKANYISATPNVEANNVTLGSHRFSTSGIGADYQIAANLKSNLSYYDRNDQTLSKHVKITVASLNYYLSKRTELYGMYAHVRADSFGTYLNPVFVSLMNMDADQAALGGTTNAVQVGIVHRF